MGQHAQLIVATAGAVIGGSIGGPQGAQIGWAQGQPAIGLALPTKAEGEGDDVAEAPTGPGATA